MKLKHLKVEHRETKVELPYYECGSGKEGNHLFLTGGMHGDEVNGVYAVGQVIDWIKQNGIEDRLKGKITIIPVLNITGFRKSSRVTYPDKKDLNRRFSNFDSKTDVTFSDVLAQEIIEKLLKNCSMGVDVHDAGEGAILLPHARIHKSDKVDCESCSRELARFFGVEYILEREGSASMMAVAMNNRFDLPVITVEVGGAQQIYTEASEIAVRGFKNILIANSMLDGELYIPEHQFVIKNRVGLKAKKAGVLLFQVELGDKVERGESVGLMYHPISQEYHKVVSPATGTVFSLWPNCLAPEGRTIMSVVNLEKDNDSADGKVVELGYMESWKYNQ
jgi:hypothetical protein